MFKALAVVKAVPSWVYIAAAAGVALYVIKKGGVQGAAAGVTAGVIDSAGDVVKGAAQGVVLGVGDILGIPRVNESLCTQAMKAGDNWNAAKYCDAGTALAWQYAGAKSKLERFVLNAKGFF